MSIELVLALDIETTGLDDKLDGILEVCAKVVRPDFTVLDFTRQFVTQPLEILARMSEAVRAQHEKSGLLLDVSNFGKNVVDADQNLADFVKKHWKEKDRPLLLGNSIHFDRRFLKSQMPIFEKLLHYRMIDVSALREAVRIFGSPHRAPDDVDSSIEQCKAFIARLR